MRVLLQRVREASVEVNGQVIARVRHGWVVLVGVGQHDTLEVSSTLAEKVMVLRCFEDAAGKTNLAAGDVGAEWLVVSQFTLYADTSRGRRPSFVGAAPPDMARALVERFAATIRARGFHVAEGQFAAHMQVHLVNDGPFTLWLDSERG